MVFSLSFDATKLQAAFNNAALAVSRELRVELGNALDVVCRDARTNHRFKTGSGTGHGGKLEQSIQAKVEPTGLSGVVEIKNSVAPYGKYVHEGTGKYGRGHGEYKISAKNKKALYFVSGGQGFLVPKGGTKTGTSYVNKRGALVIGKGYVIHPGIKPDPFLYEAFTRQKPFIMARLRGAVSKALQMAGLK